MIFRTKQHKRIGAVSLQRFEKRSRSATWIDVSPFSHAEAEIFRAQQVGWAGFICLTLHVDQSPMLGFATLNPTYGLGTNPSIEGRFGSKMLETARQ